MTSAMILLFPPVALIIFHVMAVRMKSAFKMRISYQVLLVYSLLLYNLPVLCVCLYLLGSFTHDIAGYIYFFLVYDSFAYLYGGIFNMSESARRIKILIGIKSKKISSLSDLSEYYDPDKGLEIRLKRLEGLSQIMKNKDKEYVLKSRMLYVYSLFILPFRILLGFEDNIHNNAS